MEITVCHFSPRTSKWNKIESKLFSFISMNWQGKLLESYQAVVYLIGTTKTRRGLKVKAVLDENIYEKGIRITDEELEKINLSRLKFHGEWNYTINKNIQLFVNFTYQQRLSHEGSHRIPRLNKHQLENAAFFKKMRFVVHSLISNSGYH